jgi:hypothetical protein
MRPCATTNIGVSHIGRGTYIRCIIDPEGQHNAWMVVE